MRHKLFCALLAAVMAVLAPAAALAAVSIDAANFPDANFRSYILDQVDNGDGTLSDAEIAGTTLMDISSMGISDLTGISYFTALTSLDCSMNGLSTLNVSACTALLELNCRRNAVTSLNIRGCSALRILRCGSNALSALDLSGCTNLRLLYCQMNDLTTLDVSACTKLAGLQCNNNQLTTLEGLGSCEALQNLDCKSNKLNTLDVSRCRALKTLECNKNRLSILDLANCVALQTVNFSGQAINEITVESTGDASYPYQVDLSRHGVPSSRVGRIDAASVKGYDSSKSAIASQYDTNTGILRLTQRPSSVGYSYDTQSAAAGNASARLMDVTLSAAPTVLTTELTEPAYVGQSYRETLEASGAATLKWTWAAAAGSTLPEGLKLSSAGSISGKPTRAGTYTFIVTVTNSVGHDDKRLTLTVRPEEDIPQKPKITTKSSDLPKDALLNEPFPSFTLEATGTKPITWKLEDGSKLPNGLTLSEAGVISGTPTESGSFPFVVKAENSVGEATKSLSLKITKPDELKPDGPTAPKIVTRTLPIGVVGTYYEAQLEATGTTPITWRLDSSSKLPDGLTLSESGLISGTPTTARTFQFSVWMDNIAGSQIANRSITISRTGNNSSGDSGGGGGCSAGFGGLAVAALAALALKRRR